jgi:predicted RNase H-like HicB family nuclease
MTIQLEFHLYGQIKKKGKWFIAHCPPLDLSTQGETFEVARKNLIEASQLFLTSCLERRTLDQALRELGFVPVPNEMQEDSLPEGDFSFPVRIPFVFQKPSECHAKPRRVVEGDSGDCPSQCAIHA